jgi:integrase
MKRSYGTGSLQQRGEKSWRLIYRDADERHFVSFKGTKKEAEIRLRQILSSIDKGSHVAPDRKTLGQWADEWYALKTADGLMHRTTIGYQDLLRRYVLPELGEKPLQAIKPLDIQQLYAGLTELSPRTRNHVGTVLKACLEHAVALRLIPINPCDNIKKPRAVDTDIGTALEQDELVKLIDGFRNHNLFEIVFLAAFTGMRRGELLGLRWSDIDFNAKTITVDQSLEYTKQFGLQFKPPKSERASVPSRSMTR